MSQSPTLSHDDYCRIIGQLYIDAQCRIDSLEKQVGSGNPLPMVAILQQKLEALVKQNHSLQQQLEAEKCKVGNESSTSPASSQED